MSEAGATGELPAEVAKLWQLSDIITPLAIRVAATLRVADHIAAGTADVEGLSRLAGAAPDALRRLLRYLAARGLFTENESGRFALTGLGAVLRDDHPRGSRRWLDLEGFGGAMDLSFTELLATVRTGRTPRAMSDTGIPEAVASSFDDMMETQSVQQTPAIVAGWDWSRVEHVADLGGGTGTLLVGLLNAYPDMRATLIELKRVADRARRLMAEENVAERCEVIAGDLFEVPLPAANAYILKFVLHGLDDDSAVKLLRRCGEAGGAGARILVIERSLGQGDDRQAFTAMDLRMLILGTGRERTLEEYGALGARAGLRLIAAMPTAVGVHIIDLAKDRMS